MDTIETRIGGTRISRRAFTALWPLALAPTVWIALDCCGSAVSHSLDYLRTPRRDGGKGGSDLGATALLTQAVVRSTGNADSPTVVNGLKHLKSLVQPDGGIYTPGRGLEHHETCLAARCLSEVNAEGRYDGILRSAAKFVRTCQWGEGRGAGRSDATYGGAGYGRRTRPDLVNTSLLLDTVKFDASGRRDPAVERALAFVSRCQDVRGSSPGGGGFRSGASEPAPSCGVMTMIGLKSLLQVGVGRNDARVGAALAWIRSNYDMARNPGMGNAGLYHYYHACAEALLASGVDEIEDAGGVKHDWRKELSAEVVRRQRKDGSWGNENGCWMEDDPHIATAHALLALSYCQQPPEKTA